MHAKQLGGPEPLKIYGLPMRDVHWIKTCFTSSHRAIEMHTAHALAL